MSEEVRRIARRARRQGWSAVKLAHLTDQEWQTARLMFGCEDASDGLLADVVDRVLVLEQSVDVDNGGMRG